MRFDCRPSAEVGFELIQGKVRPLVPGAIETRSFYRAVRSARRQAQLLRRECSWNVRLQVNRVSILPLAEVDLATVYLNNPPKGRDVVPRKSWSYPAGAVSSGYQIRRLTDGAVLANHRDWDAALELARRNWAPGRPTVVVAYKVECLGVVNSRLPEYWDRGLIRDRGLSPMASVSQRRGIA